MDSRKKVGQLFVVGFHGTTAGPIIKTLIREYGVGAVILFKRNIVDAAQLQSLTLALQQEAKDAGHEYPLFIGIDQENGLVTRISPPVVSQLPGSMALGAADSTDFAYEVGKATGRTLEFFGINMNYAPVCDINSEPRNPVIGVRSFGDDPEFVGRFASAMAKGLRESNVVPTVKHFPGHGDTAVDSHFGLPVIEKSRDDLERCELVPFRRAVAEGIEAVMTAHIALPQVGANDMPATLSVEAMNILREDMKYQGMVVTDCLEMDGIRTTYGTERGSVLALKAGSDSIMVCHKYSMQVASILTLCDAIRTGEIPHERLEEAFGRVTQLKKRFLNWETALSRKGHEQLAGLNESIAALSKKIYSHSTTVIRDKKGLLPLSKIGNVILLSPGESTPAGGAVHSGEAPTRSPYIPSGFIEFLRIHNNTTVDILYNSAGLSADEWMKVDQADAVIFASRNALEALYQRTLGLELAKRTNNLIVVATCNPYDFLEDEESVETYIATYEPTPEAFAAAADVIFGSVPGKGHLPIGRKALQPAVPVFPFHAPDDLEQVAKIWNAALPTYPLTLASLQRLLVRSNGHHFVARIGSDIVGVCVAYTATKQGKITGQIAALVVDPSRQGQGIGTTLLADTRAYFRNTFGLSNIALSSVFPRFWPGIPTDLPSRIPEFFIHRGFRVTPLDATHKDLYQDIRNYQPPSKYVERARQGGYTFGPLQPEQYDACIAGQRKNFGYYAGWVDAYVTLNPVDHPSSVMVAFDPEGNQVGWTLMLGPSCPLLQQDWALPPLCGPNTGLIGCVGVDTEHRKAGVGLAMLCHAILNMKDRGVEGVFVDWVSMKDWYEKVGFEAWRRYRLAEI
ncbi:CAZyme family GH3 [Paecilomyces variotii]|nr:CAZyme family GH3 [Paecilomyces variotii]